LNVHFYRTIGGKNLIYDFLDSLSVSEKAEAYYILETLEGGSVNSLHKLDIKHFENKIWEIRFRKFNRIFYVLKDNNNIYLLHACKKQKNSTETNDKRLAIKRAKEI
jgi:phage-related protein